MSEPREAIGEGGTGRARRESPAGARASAAPPRAGDRRAWVTPALVASNLLAYLALVIASDGASTPRPDALARWGANVGVLTAQGEWWRLLTGTFLHLGLAHLALNLWALWSLGRAAERCYGSVALAAIYLAAAVLASLGSLAWDPSRTGVGASGAILGIGGALLAYLARRGRDVPAEFARTQRIVAGVFVGVSVAAGFAIPGIDNAAHVAGLATGAALGWLLAPALERGVDVGPGQPAHRGPEQPAGAGRERPARVGRRGAVAAAALALLAVAAGTAFVRVPESREPSLHALWRSHPWYAAGEARTLAAWARLTSEAAAGRLSMADFATALEREVLPFWQRAVERLGAGRAAAATRAGAAATFEDRVFEFVRARRDLAQAQVEAARRDGELDSTRPLASALLLAQARVEYRALRGSIAARSRGLAAAQPLQRARLWFATRGRCQRPPPGAMPGLPGPGDSASDGPARRIQAGCEAQRLFVAGRHRELDALLAAHVARPNDLPDGSSSLTGAYSGFDALFVETGLDLRDALVQVHAWRRAAPGSVQPELVESQALRAWARQAVDADGRTTSTELQLQRSRGEMANEALGMAQPAGAAHPVWYTLSMFRAFDEPDGLASARRLFDAGVARFPTHHPLYYGMLRLLQPRSQGSFEQVAAFIDEVTARAPEDERAPLYARLYTHFAALEGDDADVFANAGADWSVIERGFRRLLARHPDSDFLLNAFAGMACRRGDAATYRELRPAVVARRSAAAWQGDVQPETCDARLAGERAPATPARARGGIGPRWASPGLERPRAARAFAFSATAARSRPVRSAARDC